MGPVASWNAYAHRFIGEVSVLEVRMDYLLALADARDVAAVERLSRLYGRLSTSERVDLLRKLGADPEASTVAGWLATLFPLRNRLAHARVVDANPSRATFFSFYRGRRSDVSISSVEMERAFRMAREANRLLDYLEPHVGDPVVWGRLMGFDQR